MSDYTESEFNALKAQKDAIISTQQEKSLRTELETVLNNLSAELDRRYKESIGKWNRCADVYEQGKADGYDMADQLIKSYFRDWRKRNERRRSN